nr:MAG TPA: hypothetical protein [Caudoviricetes sp.]
MVLENCHLRLEVEFLDRLKTDYKDDVFTGQRKYRELDNGDSTKTFVDTTVYSQKGDKFGAKDVNGITKTLNALQEVRQVFVDVSKWSNTAPFTQEIEIPGMQSTDVPIVGLLLTGSETAEVIKALNKSFSRVDFVETLDGKVRVKCLSKKPEVSFTLALKGV